MTLKGYLEIERKYSPNVMVLAVKVSSAGEAQVVAPIRGQLIHRVEVQQVFLTAALAQFRSWSCSLLLHMQVTSCEACK